MGQKGCRFSLFLFTPVQANLALSPTALLPPPKSPDVKLHPAPLSPLTPSTPGTTPPTPLSPGLRHQSCEEEEPVGFEAPAEGTTLPNFNKTRARLSFKRRPPTRQHRRSAGEEPTSPGTSPCELSQPDQNGLNSDQVFHSPTEEEEPTTTNTTTTTGEQEEATEGESDTIQEEEKSCTEEEETEEQSTRREGQEETSSEPSAEEREEKEVKEEKEEEKSQEEEDADEGM